MPPAARSRAPVVFLLLAFLALPALGQPTRPSPAGRGLLAALWQSFLDLVPASADLGPGLDPLGGPKPQGSGSGPQEPSGHQGDLGPGLDPLGSE
jgi:hypothetical protein